MFLWFAMIPLTQYTYSSNTEHLCQMQSVYAKLIWSQIQGNLIVEHTQIFKSVIVLMYSN